jgi:hypothetical protein
MTVREWTVKFDTTHSVRVEHHSALSGRVVILVDGREVFRRPRKFWDFGLEHRFQLDGRPCLLRIQVRTYNFDYELWADHKLQ